MFFHVGSIPPLFLGSFRCPSLSQLAVDLVDVLLAKLRRVKLMQPYITCFAFTTNVF